MILQYQTYSAANAILLICNISKLYKCTHHEFIRGEMIYYDK